MNKTRKRWQDEDHSFTPENITKLEVCITVDVKRTFVKAGKCSFTPRWQRPGKVRIILGGRI